MFLLFFFLFKRGCFKLWNIILCLLFYLTLFIGKWASLSIPERNRISLFDRIHNQFIKFFNFKVYFSFQYVLSLKFQQNLCLFTVLHYKMTFPIPSILLSIEYNVDNSWYFFRICLINWFWWGFKWHVWEIYSQGFLSRVGR